ncbi:zinc-binding alcohol dehydrogenase family protein [Terrarubrum flagellatum]|uniref:zinc-binding alcohol dehydrogenase family protein n=1 Tax=Terrirubrum flagellatum TaxID=2895980 RepID=UPI0031456EE6
MRALSIDGPSRLSFREIPEPSPRSGEAMIEIAYIGYCGSDLNSFRGLNPLVSYPRIPGHEISGMIAALGEGAPGHLAVGQSVTILPYFNCGACNACRLGRPNACKNNETMGVQREGALARFVCVPCEKVIPVDGMRQRDLALVEPLAVGFHAVARADVAKGERVVVLGCGVIGLGALLGAKRRGAETLVVDVSAAKLERALALGADVAVDASREDVAAAVAKFGGAMGPQAVIEAVGATQTFQQAIDLVASCGRVVYVGYAKEKVAYETRFFLMKEIDIRGSRGSTREDFEHVIDYLRSHSGAGDVIISRIASFDEAPQAMIDWDRDPGAFTKVMIELDGRHG